MTGQVWVSVCLCVSVCLLCVYMKIDYERLSHAIMELQESQDLQSVSRRPRRVDYVSPVWVQRPKNHES